MYELPLERGRAEAAPKSGGGTPIPGEGDESASGTAVSGDDEDSDEEGSLYRSENNFGSSSHVPGTPLGEDAGSAASGDGAESEAATNLVQGREAVQVADSGNTSPAANIALLGAIALIALGFGVLVSRAGRFTTGH